MLLLGGSLSLCAQSKYPPIEELVYTGYYNWGFGSRLGGWIFR